ncbi:MAG TPA: PrsW family intramembrane metalloprotease [Polyangiaceae bacterium]|nr:PrsW family intramembrane metalloprotease [Polyangiaceae bacterium]
MAVVRDAFILFAACVLALAGCGPALPGSNDAALVYAVQPDPTNGAAPGSELVAAAVKARLSAAQITADVEAAGDAAVRVVIDADGAATVDSLVTWRGGIEAYRLDDDVVIAPPNTAGLRPMSAPLPDGRTDRWWQGPPDAIARTVTDARLDARHVAFAERLDGGDWRTHVAQTPALADLGIGSAAFVSIDRARSGRALAMTFATGSLDPIAAERTTHPQGRVAIARGRTLLAALPVADALARPLVLDFGKDLAAYTRAEHARMLLSSPVLPPMRRASLERLGPRRGLSAACAVLPFVVSFGWLFFVRRFDRARPEPMWLVVATFGLGGLAIVPAALLELACASATPWLDPSLMTFGGQAWALPIGILVFAVVVGLSEEGSKFLAAWSLAGHRREFDEPVDGIIYGCASALGFAAVENVKYFAVGRMSGVVVAARAFMTVPAHMFFGTIWGYALGRTLVSRKTRVAGWIALAALVHGAFDAVISTDGLQLLATVLVVVMAVGFVWMLRHALRHGAVAPRPSRFDASTPRTQPMPASELPRRYFRVGSAGAFYGCAAAMVVTAFAMTVLGGAYEYLHHRVGVVFVSIATAILALFGLSAYGTSETIPLDVAVDARGVTFAGSCTPWRAIHGVDVDRSRRRAFVLLRVNEPPPAGASSALSLRSSVRTLRLGPADPRAAEALAEAIAAGRGS